MTNTVIDEKAATSKEYDAWLDTKVSATQALIEENKMQLTDANTVRARLKNKITKHIELQNHKTTA